ncbi:MAG: peptide-methionine (S)-S-oxide reductase [Myxococcota bacterium]
MLWTRVGYAGGAMDSPTYDDIGDHSEAIEVGYDPARISYERLLAEFWYGHRPAETAWSQQYRSAIFVHSEAERHAAERSIAVTEAKLGRPVHTAVEDASRFWQAEDYHQKYRLQRESWAWRELRAAYPDMRDLVRSTAAARLNAWVSDHGEVAQLERELPLVGLSPAAQKQLRRQRR